MTETMTIKQISELTGRSRSTIEKWFQRTSIKNPQVSVKITDAQKNKKAAEFELSEIIEAIKESGNELLANLLKDNAEKTHSVKDESAKIERLCSVVEKVLEQNQTIPSNCANNNNLTDYPKYSGAGGSGKITISKPLIVYDKLDGSNVKPYFDNSFGRYKKVTDQSFNLSSNQIFQTDSDCQFKCPKIYVYQKNASVILKDFSTFFTKNQ